MKRQILFLLSILFITLLMFPISALEINSGDTINLTLDKPYVYYSITGNSTEIIIDNITQIGNNVQMTLNKYNLDDSFDLIFFDIEREVITVYQNTGSSGGHSHTKNKVINNTKEVEVPNYISIENKTTEYINNTITKWKEMQESNKENWIILILSILVMIILLSFFIRKLNKKYLNELNKKEFVTGDEEND